MAAPRCRAQRMMLYQHQVAGAEWLAARRTGYLGDVPGIGKTLTLLRATQLRGVSRVLVVCPAIVRTHWRREADVLGMRAVTVRSYDDVTRNGADMAAFDALLIDEVHYAKHADALRTKALLGKGGCARHAGLDCIYVASGTPVSKHPAEIWTVLASLFPDVARAHGLGSHAAFVDRFCLTSTQYVRGRVVEKIHAGIKPGREVEYREILDAIMLRRTLDDVGLDVPPLDWQPLELDGGALEFEFNAHTEIVHALNSDYDNALADIASDPHVARMRRRLGELKVGVFATALRAQLGEDGDEKVVVFAHHRDVLSTIMFDLTVHGYDVAYVDGDVSDAERTRRIDRFQTDPTCRVFLGQNIACQTGITLTAARRVILVEPDWTRDVNLQLAKRVARIGQTAERCVAQMVVLAGTLDDAIVRQNLREVRMADDIGLGIA
jgi:SWI/SNF-related matrix-associated actin-dependent regulator 1 of chromatin subfamily A